MTQDQFEMREERIAIMMAEGVSLGEAETVCNFYSELYGYREVVE